MKMNLRLRFLAVLSFIAIVTTAIAKTYTIEDIPNVHLADSTQYVSNPDGILSQSTVSQLNSAINSIRREATAEPVVVVVDDIDSEDIDSFATELFTEWGLGKKDRDNGLLLLVAVDSHQVCIRPGYGLEGVLTDVLCGRILRNVMFPSFREGDYDEGVINAVSEIKALLLDPNNISEILSSEEDADHIVGADTDDITEIFSVYLGCAAMIALVLLITYVAKTASIRKKDDYDKYAVLVQFKVPYLVLTFLGLGLPLIATIPLLLKLKRLRSKPRICTNCGKAMTKVDEIHDNAYLNKGQDLEERLGSVDYDVWLCTSCGETTIEAYVQDNSGYEACPKCKVRAYRLKSERVVRRPTTKKEGLGVRTYSCKHCGYSHDDDFTIPRDDDSDGGALAAGAALGALGAILGNRGSGGFGGFGGGGFGGGSTGGGGASGRW